MSVIREDILLEQRLISSLIQQPELLSLIEGQIEGTDFGNKAARVAYETIQGILKKDLRAILSIDMIRNEAEKGIYANDCQSIKLESFLQNCNCGIPQNFGYDVQEFRKNSLLRTLEKQGFDVSPFANGNETSVAADRKAREKYQELSCSDICDYYDGQLSTFRRKFAADENQSVPVGANLRNMIEEFKKAPEIGTPLLGKYMNTIVRGARFGKYYLRSAGTNVGKALTNDTLVPTFFNGYQQVGDIQQGDFLIDRKGKPTKVLAVFPQGEKAIHEVELDDGRIIYCCGDHLWQVERGEESLVWNTRMVMKGLENEQDLYLPQITAPDFPHSNVDTDWVAAYLLSYLVGIVAEKPFSLAEVEKLLFVSLLEKLEVIRLIKKVIGEKIRSNNPEVLEFLVSVLHSCGFWATIQNNEIITKHGSFFHKENRPRIVAVRKTNETTEMTCFCVDNEESLFLVGDFIPTHNSRLSLADTCYIAIPEYYDEKRGSYVREKREPGRALIITTETDADEVQTILLAFLSGVNEEHILFGRYDVGEEARVQYAVHLLEKYSDSFFIERLGDPNLSTIAGVVKRYVSVHHIQYCCYDYIFTSPSLIDQFSSTHIREDVALTMLSTLLKDLATQYGIFMLSATQLNGDGTKKDKPTRDQNAIRGAKGIADKCDVGIIITQIGEAEKRDLELVYTNNFAIRGGLAPTHVMDVYKVRRGRYKGVRVWARIDLGTGRREDLFVTDQNFQVIEDMVLIPPIVSEVVDIEQELTAKGEEVVAEQPVAKVEVELPKEPVSALRSRVEELITVSQQKQEKPLLDPKWSNKLFDD